MVAVEPVVPNPWVVVSVVLAPAAAADSESAVAVAAPPTATSKPVDSTKTPATLRRCIVKMMFPRPKEMPGPIESHAILA